MKEQTNIRIREFTDLIVWQEGHKLVLSIYRLSKTFPKSELFGLTDQIRRASVSVTSNIAEGFGRFTYKERSHFYFIAQGSLSELKNQLLIARDIGYISTVDFNIIQAQANLTHKILHGLISRIRKFISSPASLILTPASSL